MRITFTSGAVFRVHVSDDDFAFGVMLSHFPYMAFYGKGESFDSDGVPVGQPMFVVSVSKSAYFNGEWGEPIHIVPFDRLYPIPRFFWQSPVNKNDCKIIEPVMRRVSASPRDCVGLEAEAVWEYGHIESRIVDTYAGRSNAFVDSLRVKL